jgi:hypothetical protein
MKKTILIALLCAGASMAHAGGTDGVAGMIGMRLNGIRPNGTELQASVGPDCDRPVHAERCRQLEAAPPPRSATA